MPSHTNGTVTEGPNGIVLEIDAEPSHDRWERHEFGFERVSDPSSNATKAEDLPHADRAVVERALRDGGTVDLADGRTVDGRTTRVDDGAIGQLSVLPYTSPIEYRGETYRVHVRPLDVGPERREYTATVLAPNATAYGHQLIAENGVDLQSLTPAEQNVVERAIDGRCVRGEVPDEAYDAVVEQIEAADSMVVEDVGRRHVVHYDGVTYAADVEDD